MSALSFLIPCASCGAVAERGSARFRCPACGHDHRPTRKSLSDRAHTETVRDMKRRHLTLVTEEPETPRPRTRGDCVDGPRPCPWVGCTYHLAYEVSPKGGIKEKFPGKELEELVHTCALDVASHGPQPLDTVAFLMNITAERVRQIEAQALESCRDAGILSEEDL